MPGPKLAIQSVPPPTDSDIPAELLSDKIWQNSLIKTAKGAITKAPGNATLILSNDWRWLNVLRYNEFRQLIEWCKDPPTVPGLTKPETGNVIQDSDYVFISQWIALNWGTSFSKDAIWDAIQYTAHSYKFHPLQMYLDSLKWDGKPRIDSWLCDYLGADNTSANAAMGSMWLISGVARAMKPGCKVDHMLVLEGLQGSGKSTAFRVLAGDNWCNELAWVGDPKRSVESLDGAWIVEAAELSSLRQASQDRIKEFLTIQVDKRRKPYARAVELTPRCCIFGASTNSDNYLKDATGNRRYWPVRIRKLDLDALLEDRDQLWAEARQRYLSGEQWHPNQDMAARLASVQEDRREQDPWEGPILEYVSDRLAGNFIRSELEITISAILEKLEVPLKDRKHIHSIRIGKILCSVFGWSRWVKHPATGEKLTEARYYPPDLGE